MTLSIFLLSLQRKNMEENIMATITINYDAKNSAIRGMIAALLKFDGVTVISAKPEKARFLKEMEAAGREARQLARSRAKKRTLDDVIVEL